MRKRRKKNPLLMRIIVISIAVHAIALPIAAHYGAFQTLQKEFGKTEVVMIRTPPLEEKKRATKVEKKEKKSHPESKKGPANLKRGSKSAKPNPNQPKVETGAPDNGAGTGATADANGTGRAGVLPTGPPTPPPSSKDTTAPPPTTTPLPQPTQPKTTEPPQPPPPPPAPKPKKIVAVETTYAPEPTIPDDLRYEPFEKTLVVEADVNTQGTPENVKIADSTGSKELDDIGMKTAMAYKFKPATVDDVPVEGHVRFHIIFKVE